MNGQAVFTTNLAEGMVKNGHTVMVLLDSHHVQADHKVINGVLVEELPSISLNFLHAGIYFSPFPGRDVRRLFDAFKPEVVHIQDHYPSCWAVVHTARKLGIKIVGSNHFIPENLAPYIPLVPHLKPIFNWIMWQWMLMVYRQTDIITAQSSAAARLITRWRLKQSILPISCGIDLQRLMPNLTEDRSYYRQRYHLDPEKIILLFLGRIDGEKRVDLLVRAMHRLGRDDIQLAIAGFGKVEAALRSMVTDLGLQEKVVFTGFIPAEDVPGLLNSIDVFVMPSEAELLSISTLEAMACGRPVLLANALALPELVKDGVNGYLFKPGKVDDLVRLMKVMADQPERWGEMGAASREIALHHSLEDTIDRFERLYTQLIGQVPVRLERSRLKEQHNNLVRESIEKNQGE